MCHASCAAWASRHGDAGGWATGCAVFRCAVFVWATRCAVFGQQDVVQDMLMHVRSQYCGLSMHAMIIDACHDHLIMACHHQGLHASSRLATFSPPTFSCLSVFSFSLVALSPPSLVCLCVSDNQLSIMCLSTLSCLSLSCLSLFSYTTLRASKPLCP